MEEDMSGNEDADTSLDYMAKKRFILTYPKDIEDIEDEYSLNCSETLSDTESTDIADNIADCKIPKNWHPAESTEDILAKDTLEYLEIMPRDEFMREFGEGETKIRQLIREQDRHNRAKQIRQETSLGIVNTTLRAAIQMKHNWLEYASDQMFECYYRGNLAIFRCAHCFFCLDAFPCKEKREYAVPRSRCCYCTKTFNHVGAFGYFDSVKVRDYEVKHYVISEEAGLNIPM